MNNEKTCPKHPDRKATMPTLRGAVCAECFFREREEKRLRDRKPIVVEAKA